MEAKDAYQQLLDEREGRGRPGSTSSSSGGGFGSGRAGSSSAGGTWGYRGSGTSSGAGAGGYGRPPPQQPRWQPAEEAYSFGERPWVARFYGCLWGCCHSSLLEGMCATALAG